MARKRRRIADALVVPRNRATGCLPRKYPVGKVCGLFSEHIDVLDDGEIQEFLSVSNRPNVKQILDQNGVGSCATESTTQSIMTCRERDGQPFELLNPWFIYHHTSGGADRGSSIDENLLFVRDKGAAPESVWPRSKGFRARPSDEAYAAALNFRIDEFYDITTMQEIKTAVVRGFPVVYGWSGHSCLFVSLKDLLTAEYANSWAPTWGDQGFGTLRLSSVNFMYGAFAVRTTKIYGGAP